jgi:hypothetical protein
MAEYKYVSLPTDGKETRSEKVDMYASDELNRVWVAAGWEVVSVTRPMNIGPIGFLLRRDDGR